MKKSKYLIIALFLLSINLSAYDLIVFSGAGLIKPVSEIIETFEKDNKIKIESNYDGSGALYGKYMSGFPCDVIILGGKVMENMQYESIVDNDTYQEIIYHTPVIIVSPDNNNIKELKDLENEKIKLALGSKKGPVIGDLSYRIFEKNKLKINSENIVVETPTVNQLLLYVINKTVDASIVWANNAKISQRQNKIKIIEIPQEKNIMELNKQVSEDAEKLTKALKGDSKTQGDWGEIQLELILEKAGLVKDIHYQSQENFKSEDGKNLRPDYIINLPDDKKVIIDSKVSLTAYENFFNTENEEDKKNYLKAHLDSINRHINELSAKNYQTLYGINQPDFVLLFVPIEPALLVAVKEDKKIFEKALGKNIVLVSTSTLLATLRTISYIWKQENQKQNVYEIAQESGKLYDKFVGFMEDLVGVGRKIDDAKGSYLSAMNKLISSSKKGDTIVGRMERIKNLGANSSKSLAKNILERVEE